MQKNDNNKPNLSLVDNTKFTETPEINDFIEKMGLALESDGLPRISGRIFGYLIVFGGPVSFASLSTALQVSRGSISTNARLLTELGVIERTSFAGDRQDYYKLAENPGAKIIAAALSRIKHVENIIESAKSEIPESIEGSPLRLQQMSSLYSVIGKQLDISLQELDEEKSSDGKVDA